jgi:fatty acid desaturase
MTPEQREQRATELQRQIGREWAGYVIADLAIVAVLLGALAYGATRDADQFWFVAVTVGYFAVTGGLFLVRQRVRIRPRRAEIERLRGGAA